MHYRTVLMNHRAMVELGVRDDRGGLGVVEMFVALDLLSQLVDAIRGWGRFLGHVRLRLGGLGLT